MLWEALAAPTHRFCGGSGMLLSEEALYGVLTVLADSEA